MNRASRKRLIRLIAVANVLASAAGGAAAVALSGGNGAARSLSLGENQALAAAAAKPPPVVDGVRRYNVASAHSPRLSGAGSGAAAPPPANGAMRGIDVASWEHPHGDLINWTAVARAGYKFAFVKASEGNYYANPYYATDLAQAKAAGLIVTGYHFAVPNVSSGAGQADYAVKHARYTADGRMMPLALDIEYNPYGAECYGLTGSQMVAWIRGFTTESAHLTGQSTIIYTTADWWRTCTGGSTAFGSDPLWIAGSRGGSPLMPAGWGKWTFWQYTSQASVPGVAGQVDVSYFGPVVRLLDPGAQRSLTGTAIRLQVRSLNAAFGQQPVFTALGLPDGMSISARGLITGTISASATGQHAVTVTALTPAGITGAVSFTWTVEAQVSPSPSPSPAKSA